MAPKPDSRAVIRKGNQSVHAQTKNEKERAVILKPSTERALQLQRAKGGAGDRISGRLMMEFIAEDEMETRRKALMESAKGTLRAPFAMEVAKKVAQSQMDAYIDIVNHLHDSEFCYYIIDSEIRAQCPPPNISDPDPFQSPSFVAEQFAILIHNSYMLASGWTIVYESLKYLERMGLDDKAVPQQLKDNSQLRTVYLSAFNLLKKLASASQQRLRSIAQNTVHYSKYFKASTHARGQVVFNNLELQDLNKSFLDSAIIELCLPGSEYSPQALYHILNSVEKDFPKELKRCPQIMWDTVGDLAEAVRLLDLMEMPLLVAGGDIQAADDSGEFAEFSQWDEAQEKSIRAALDISSFVNLVHPLANIKSKITLDKLWDRIDGNYVRASGKKIDALWQLIDVRVRIPHFSVLYVPQESLNGKPKNGIIEQPKKILSITQNGERTYDSDDSMPALLEVSDSDEENVNEDYLSDTDTSDEDEDDSGSDGYEEEFDNDEDDLRKQFREAMNIVTEMPEVFDLPPESDKYAKERKGNPFLNLLGKLKGRMFTSSSALRTDGKVTATAKPSAPKAKKPTVKATPAVQKPVVTEQKKATQATVEDADDESDEASKSDKKKKKKKPKKKKKSTTDETTEATVETPTSPTPSQIPFRNEVSPPSSSTVPKVEKRLAPPIRTNSIQSSMSGTTAFGSAVSLPLPVESKAESARKYLAEVGLDQIKAKVKTRPEQPVDRPEQVKEGRQRLFGRFGSDTTEESKKDSKESYNAIFGRLKNKTSLIARKVFGASAQDKKGAVKWEQFLQVMRELGFSYDPSTAGSSVRFDPPNPTDRSVTFHKPHPDPTLQQYRLRDIRAKLRDYYGFTFKQFDDAVNNTGTRMGVDSDEY